ncbi:hypothetical protein [Streptomyces antimycoticus]|uniref:hypothetical protein n=1 Tax=Streptomyces antimycoticus TaxID=68175 RepID=UPI00191BAC60|nr:hypothetical protein [Streptomyces antimycoticus]
MTDLPELIGGAAALNLLFGMPMLPGALPPPVSGVQVMSPTYFVVTAAAVTLRQMYCKAGFTRLRHRILFG